MFWIGRIGLKAAILILVVLLSSAIQPPSSQAEELSLFIGHATVEVVSNGQPYQAGWDFALRRNAKLEAIKWIMGTPPCPDPKDNVCKKITEDWWGDRDVGIVRIGDGAALVNARSRISEIIFAVSRPPDKHQKDFVIASWLDNVQHPNMIWTPEIVGFDTLGPCPDSFPIKDCRAKVDIVIDNLAALPATYAGTVVQPGYGGKKLPSPLPELDDMTFVEFRYYTCDASTWNRPTKSDGIFEHLISGAPLEAVLLPTNHPLKQGCDPDAKFNINADVALNKVKSALSYQEKGKWVVPPQVDKSHRYYRYETPLKPKQLPFSDGKAFVTGVNAWQAVNAVSGPFGTIKFPSAVDSLENSVATYAARSTDGTLYVFSSPIVYH